MLSFPAAAASIKRSFSKLDLELKFQQVLNVQTRETIIRKYSYIIIEYEKYQMAEDNYSSRRKSAS